MLVGPLMLRTETWPQSIFQNMLTVTTAMSVVLSSAMPIEAIGIALDKTTDMAVVTVSMFWKMLWGQVSVRNISGPTSIAEFAGYSLGDGLVPFLDFLAVISISRGLINLLPIPLLDGGQLMY